MCFIVSFLPTKVKRILFYIILTTTIIMALGMIFYKKKPDQLAEESQFSERSDIL